MNEIHSLPLPSRQVFVFTSLFEKKRSSKDERKRMGEEGNRSVASWTPEYQTFHLLQNLPE